MIKDFIMTLALAILIGALVLVVDGILGLGIPYLFHIAVLAITLYMTFFVVNKQKKTAVSGLIFTVIAFVATLVLLIFFQTVIDAALAILSVDTLTNAISNLFEGGLVPILLAVAAVGVAVAYPFVKK